MTKKKQGLAFQSPYNLLKLIKKSSSVHFLILEGVVILTFYRQMFPFGSKLSLCHKLRFSKPSIFGTGCPKLLIFQTQIISSDRNHSLKNLRSTPLGCKDIVIRKSEFVAKTQFHCLHFLSSLFIKNKTILKTYPPKSTILNVDFALKLDRIYRSLKSLYVSNEC